MGPFGARDTQCERARLKRSDTQNEKHPVCPDARRDLDCFRNNPRVIARLVGEGCRLATQGLRVVVVALVRTNARGRF